MRISDWSSDVCSSDLQYRIVSCVRQVQQFGLAAGWPGRRGATAHAQRRPGRPPSGGLQGPQGLLIVLLQMVHVEIAGGFEPGLVEFDSECSAPPENARPVREEQPHMCPPLALLVQSPE